MEKACRECKILSNEDVCPICKKSTMSANWQGYVIILNPENSEIAKKLEIKARGRYALRVK